MSVRGATSEVLDPKGSEENGSASDRRGLTSTVRPQPGVPFARADCPNWLRLRTTRGERRCSTS